MTNERRLHFVLDWGFLRGLHDTWAEPDSGVETIGDVRKYIDYVVRAERAGIDGYFVTDFIGLNRDWVIHRPRPPFEPLTLLGALATHTERIGLVGTVSTTYTEPYNVARQLRSLDHLSGGRAGWNAVTSFNGERNYGYKTLPDPEERYRRAEEYVDVVERLWDSWRPGAVLRDRARNTYADLTRVVDIEHRGAFYGVRDALDLEPSRQGRPVQFQAGASEAGIRFAGRHAEAVFVTTPSIEDAVAYERQLVAALHESGRRRTDVAILPGLRVFIAATHDDAVAAFLRPLSDDEIESARFALDREYPGLGLRHAELDRPVPAGLLPSDEDIRRSGRRVSTALTYLGLARRGWSSVREYLTHYFHSKGHAVVVGTPEEVAADLVRWYASGAVDGFTVSGGNDVDSFYEDVLPRLAAAGVWTPTVAGRTFREHLQLDR